MQTPIERQIIDWLVASERNTESEIAKLQTRLSTLQQARMAAESIVSQAAKRTASEG